MNKKLKVLVVGSCNLQHFPIVDYGGIESCVEHLCTGIDNHFKDVIDFSVIVPKITQKHEITDQYKFRIIETNCMGCSYANIGPEQFIGEVKNIIKSSPVKPDVIWAQGHWSAQHLHDLNIPIISTINDSGPWVEGKFFYKENVYYRFVSKFLYEYVLEAATHRDDIAAVKSQSFWCHTGLDDYEFDYELNKEDYILWVGGLHWGWSGKGLDRFVELARRIPEQKFVTYGTGNDQIEFELKQVCTTLPNLEFRGKLNRDHTHKQAFKKAKMFAMFSTIPEAFGRTGLEALSKGTPVLGSTAGSVPEQVNHSGVGFCSDNIEDLVNAIKQNNLNPKSSFDYAKKHYHIKNEINSLLEFTKKIKQN